MEAITKQSVYTELVNTGTLTVTQLAKRLNASRSTTERRLTALVKDGFSEVRKMGSRVQDERRYDAVPPGSCFRLLSSEDEEVISDATDVHAAIGQYLWFRLSELKVSEWVPKEFGAPVQRDTFVKHIRGIEEHKPSTPGIKREPYSRHYPTIPEKRTPAIGEEVVTEHLRKESKHERQRRDSILHLVMTNGPVKGEDLADVLATTPRRITWNTIKDLAREGRLHKMPDGRYAYVETIQRSETETPSTAMDDEETGRAENVLKGTADGFEDVFFQELTRKVKVTHTWETLKFSVGEDEVELQLDHSTGKYILSSGSTTGMINGTDNNLERTKNILAAFTEAVKCLGVKLKNEEK